MSTSPDVAPAPKDRAVVNLFGGPLARQVFEAAVEGFLVLAADGTVLAVNGAFCRMYGIDSEAVTGYHHSRFTSDLLIRRIEAEVTESLWVTSRGLQGEKVSGVIQGISNKRTGVEFLASCAASPIFEDGTFVATVITVLDVTQEWRARQSLEIALAASEVGTYRIDLAERKIYGDSNFATLHGLTKEEVNGGSLERVYAVLNQDDFDRVAPPIQEITEVGGFYEIEYRVKLPDGGFRWILSRGKAELDADGKPLQRLGSTLDITPQKLAQEALTQNALTFEGLVRNSPFGIYVVDSDFCLAIVSQGAMKVFENVKPLIGADFNGVMQTVWAEPFASEAIALFKHTLETGEPYHAPSTVEIRQDVGKMESYDWKIERIILPDGRRAVVCHFYDLSEHQRYELELERRVQERTADLVASNEALNGFTYHVAHDLRTPLRSIVSTSRILQEDYSEILPADANELLESQVRAASRLGHLIDDLLRLSRLAQQEVERVQFNLTELARDIALETLEAHLGSKVTIEVEDGLISTADPGLVRLALGNLVENAVKYSPAGGKVTVGRGVDGSYFVSDQGIGIDQMYFAKIFEPFQRLHRDHEFAGTGIGLTNVQQVIQRHGGKLWVESEPNHGSTFFFTLGN